MDPSYAMGTSGRLFSRGSALEVDLGDFCIDTISKVKQS
jgi:hypothetical protein